MTGGKRKLVAGGIATLVVGAFAAIGIELSPETINAIIVVVVGIISAATVFVHEAIEEFLKDKLPEGPDAE